MGNCPSDREKVDGLCYKKCPKGWEHVPGMPYNCRLSGAPGPYGRGVGKIPGCDPKHKVQSGALCYDPPDKGWHLLAATYWQDCPAGARDIGVACERDHYTRAPGVIWLELLKEALPWMSVGKDAAYAGAQLASGNYGGATSSVGNVGSGVYNVYQNDGN